MLTKLGGTSVARNIPGSFFLMNSGVHQHRIQFIP
jgi:hypothetical protein